MQFARYLALDRQGMDMREDSWVGAWSPQAQVEAGMGRGMG